MTYRQLYGSLRRSSALPSMGYGLTCMVIGLPFSACNFPVPPPTEIENCAENCTPRHNDKLIDTCTDTCTAGTVTCSNHVRTACTLQPDGCYDAEPIAECALGCDARNQCLNSLCGNGIVEDGEFCDGDVFDCSTVSSTHATGHSTCNATCSASDTSTCDDTPSVANLFLVASTNTVSLGLANTVSLSAIVVDEVAQPLLHLVVDFEILAPTAVSGALDSGTGIPGANGIARARYYSGSALGPVTIRASVGTMAAQTVIMIANNPGPPPVNEAQQQAVQDIVILANPADYVIGQSGTPISVLTLGADNVALDGVVVDMAIADGPGTPENWGLITAQATSSNGVAIANYSWPLSAGTVTIEAYVRSITDFSVIATDYTTINVVNPVGVAIDDGPTPP